MERPSPDLVGYREAQARLITKLGTDVLFTIPVGSIVYPEGTPINPESGEPFDPMIEPEADATGTVTLKCGVAIRGKSSTKDTEKELSVGRLEDGEGMLILQINEFIGNEIEKAIDAFVYGEHYAITQTDTDGIGDEEHRALVYIRQK